MCGIVTYLLQGYFLKNRTNFDLEDKISPVSNMTSSGLKKMLGFIILYRLQSVSENVCPVFFLDTKTNILYIMTCDMPRQMLLPMVVVDVKTTNYNDYI